MRANRVLVRHDAPTRALRHKQMSVYKFRHMVKQLMVPGDAVDVRFHDAQVWYRRRKMRVHHRAKMPVEIVRGDVHFVCLRSCRYFHRLPYAVPWRVDDGDIHCLFAEIRHEFA
jgi:hypothetical protein